MPYISRGSPCLLIQLNKYKKKELSSCLVCAVNGDEWPDTLFRPIFAVYFPRAKGLVKNNNCEVFGFPKNSTPSRVIRNHLCSNVVFLLAERDKKKKKKKKKTMSMCVRGWQRFWGWASRHTDDFVQHETEPIIFKSLHWFRFCVSTEEPERWGISYLWHEKWFCFSVFAIATMNFCLNSKKKGDYLFSIWPWRGAARSACILSMINQSEEAALTYVFLLEICGCGQLKNWQPCRQENELGSNRTE